MTDALAAGPAYLSPEPRRRRMYHVEAMVLTFQHRRAAAPTSREWRKHPPRLLGEGARWSPTGIGPRMSRFLAPVWAEANHPWRRMWGRDSWRFQTTMRRCWTPIRRRSRGRRSG